MGAHEPPRRVGAGGRGAAPRGSSNDAADPRPAVRHRAGFREEADRFIIANHQFALAFSGLANGTLCGVYIRPDQTNTRRRAEDDPLHNLLNSQEAIAEGCLWRLALTTGDGEIAVATNRNCEGFSFQTITEADGSLRLRMAWARMRVGVALVAGAAEVELLVPAEGRSALTSFQAQLPDHVSVSALEFPCISALGASDPAVEESLFLPLSGGVLVPEPRGLVVPGGGTRWEANYPGAASVQVAGYTCGREAGLPGGWQASIGVACLDPDAAPKTLSAAGMPHSNRLMLSATASPRRGERGKWRLAYPAAIVLAAGDWFEVAREYRAWAVQQPWCARGKGGLRELPALTAAHGFWFSFWGGPRAVVIVARELQRIVSVPLKLDWRCWHGCARDGAYPDYLPPRDGDQLFAQAKNQLAEAGVLTQLGFSGTLASPLSEAWQQNDAEFRRSAAGPGPERAAVGPAAAVGDEGSDPRDPEGEAPSYRDLVPMSPASPTWRERLVTLTREVAARAEGLYLEDLLAMPQRQAASSADGWVHDVRGLLAHMRQHLGAHTHLAADGPAESCLDLVDVFFTPLASAEREGLFSAQFGSRWTPLPLFSAIYHPYCTLVASAISLVNSRPFDPLWTAEVIADLHEPEDLMQQDFQRQFYVEAARAVAWGQQLMVSSFNLRQARDETCRRKLAFLSGALLAQGWGVGKLLPFSDFCGLLEVNAAPTDVAMLVNPRHSAPEERTVARRHICPVLGSAWSTPGAGIALLLANIHEQPVEFSAPLRATRLGMSGKLQVVGRTFTPDGEAPPASLHASATEISGRLPARAVFLVTMRPEGIAG